MKKKNKEKLDMSLKLVAKSSLIVFIGIFLSKALTYFYRIVIARTFGAEIYGLLSLAIMITSIAIIVSSLGLNDGLLRYLAFYRGKREYDKISYLFKNTLLILCFSSIGAGVILFLFSESIALNLFHNQELIIFLKIFSFSIPFSVLATSYLSALQAFEKIGWNSFINNIFPNVLRLTLLGIFIFLGLKSNNSVIFSYVLPIIAVFLLVYMVSKYALPEIYKRYFLNDKKKSILKKEIFSYSWPIIFLGTLYTAFNWTDSFVIGYFMDVENVGFYNAAFTLIALFGIAPQLFERLLFPMIMKEYSRKKLDLISNLSKQVSKWIFILNLPLFLIMFIFPGALLNQIFGQEFLAAESSLRILSIGGLLASLTIILTNLLSMKEKSKLILVNTIVISIIDLIMNIVLVPKYGLNGAAISTTFNYILLNIILLIEVKHYAKILPLRKKMANVFIISLVSLGILIFAKRFVELNLLNLILLGVFFVLFYLSLIFIMKCLDEYDFSILKSVKQKVMYSFGLDRQSK